MPDVFISYSRRNLDFVQQLFDALKTKGKDPWFDQLKEPLSGIAAGAPWWKQIQAGIENVDNFLFVISPDSIKSPYCHAEINYAREHGKRLVPVLYCGWIGEGETRKAIDAAIETISDTEEIPDSVTSSILNLKKLVRANWLAISEIQYVIFASSIPFDQSLEQVVQALDLDLAWVRMHSQLTQAAKLWEANNFDNDYLWGANRLKPVHDMIERRKPELDPLVQKFIEPEQERLLRELEALPETAESHGRRRDIGDRLAVIGDTRPGVGVKDDIPDIVWLPVTPGGQIKIENNTFTVQPFYIARYLITYPQYQAFVEADDGFRNREWWLDFPNEYQPQELSDQRTKAANNPRDGLSWYQSVAFGRWLNQRLEGTAIGTEGLVIGTNAALRLPTEWEWQWAAQAGNEQRKYPWGEWRTGCANTSEAGLGRAIAVGMYPHRGAVCRALDMSGNLYEWCLNNYYNPKVTDGFSNSETKVVRGGSFVNFQSPATCASRYGSLPGYDLNSYGLRVVVSAPIASLTAVPLYSEPLP